MADVSKIQLPDGSVRDIKDARITGVDLMPTSGSTNVVTSNGIDTEFAKVVYLGDSGEDASMEVSDAIEGIVMNGSRVPVVRGIANLGTILIEHQDISGKQDTISDLQTIRNGAALGATALQSFTESDPTVPAWAKASTKPTYTASEVGALPDTTVVPNITISSSEPTSSQGSNGDIWIVI